MNRQRSAAGAQKSAFTSRLPRITLLCLLLAAACLLPLAGCRRGPEPGTLVIATDGLPRGFDPRFSTGNSYSARIMQLVYDTLVTRDQSFNFVPWLAERFEESADKRTFTFHLRPGVTFHDGRPLTSADVKYTFASLLSPELKSPIRSALDKIEKIETPDPLTVIFRAREPFYTFIGNLPAIGIIPDGAGAELTGAPVGTGPFRFVAYREGDAVQLEANPAYWNGAPEVARLRVKIVPDNSTRQAELMSGEVDLAINSQFDPETVRALQRREDMRVVVDKGANVDYLGLNLAQGSRTANPKLRQAIAHAIDRELIIHRLLRDQARRADAVMPPEHWAYAGEMITVYSYDPARARQLLDEAGLPDPDGDGPRPRIELDLMTSTAQLSRNLAAILQDQLRQIGIQLNLQSLELATLFDRLARGQFDLYYLRSIGANLSPDVFQFVYHSRYQNPEFVDAVNRLRAASDAAAMRPLFDKLETILARRDYCPNEEVARLAEQAAALRSPAEAAARKQIYLRIAGLLTDRGGQNRMRYCNPRLDGWIVEAESAADRAAQMELYGRIQATVSEDVPQIYLWYPANVVVASRRVGNIQMEPSGSWTFLARVTLADP